MSGGYPPGVTQRHIDEAAGGYDEWERCTACGKMIDAPCQPGNCRNETREDEMGDGTEPRADDILSVADELYAARREIARLTAENAALKEAWARLSNFDRHDFINNITQITDEFMAKLSARPAFNAAKAAGASAIPMTAREMGDGG